MITKDVATKVKEIVCLELLTDEDTVDAEANMKDVYGMDSLDAVEMVMSLESAFDISISDEEAEKILTVNDVIKLVESKGVRQ